MAERFVFSGEEKTITGIDENGYGPVIGPLIITGIQVKAPFDSIYSLSRDILQFHATIDDSKKIFKRSKKSYVTGESLALTILKHAGLIPDTFYSLIKMLSDTIPHDLPDFRLPVWTNDRLNIMCSSIELPIIKEIRVKILSAHDFNSYVTRFKNKAFIDFLGFKAIRDTLISDVYMMGKIGGTKFYREFFKLTGEYPEPVVEEHDISYYRSDNTELFFLLNGDELFLPIMLAGILGKYIRELFMKSICEKFGLFDEIPFASGYRHDRKTFILLKEIEKNNAYERFVRIR